ncbi:tetratricopeptide repeat protein [Pseudochrobactrum sp. MP213Fo]|uniref:tetratricopeptide repeat protein n=1 Tax=Pseudochrobactrum sp. MP213Fo TaxID=3022250 RepID=UPI003B9F4A6A
MRRKTVKAQALVLALMAGAAMVTMSAGLTSASATTTAKTAPAINEPVIIGRVGSFPGAYLAGRIAEIDNNLPVAIAYYRQALAFDPSNQSMKRDLLLSYLTDGQLDEALPFAKALKNEPEVERFSRVILAIKAFNDKHYRTARTNLKLTQQSEMDRLAVGLMSAWTYAGEGRPKDALAAVQKLDGPVWYDLFKTYTSALIADSAGMSKEADKFYAQAVADKEGGSAAPDTYERIIFAYADFKQRQGDKGAAIKLVEDGEQILSGRVILREVRNKLESGSKLDPQVRTPQQGAGEVLYSLGTAINRGGAEAFATIYLQMSRELRKDNDATLFQLGDIAAKLRQTDKAIGYYSLVADKSPYKRDAEMQLSLNLAETGKTDEAIEHLTSNLRINDKDNRSYLALGGVYAQKEDFASAAKIYDQAVADIKDPVRQDWPIFYQRGIAYERLKQWDKAEPNFRKALELFPDQPQVMNYLGYSWVDRGENLEEALQMIRQAVEMRPQDGYIVDSLGWAYYKLGRYNEAVVELEKAVKLRPEDPTINDHLGDAYWQAGRGLEATFQWNHAIAGKPEADELVKIQNKLKNGLTQTAQADVPVSDPVKADAPIEKAGDKVEPQPSGEKAKDTPTVKP